MSDPSDRETDEGERGADAERAETDDSTPASEGTDDLDEAEKARIRAEKRAEMRVGETPVSPIEIGGSAHLDSAVDDGVVLVAFHDDWEGPSQLIWPVVGAVAETMPVTVATVAVGDHRSIAREFEVETIPTLLVFDDGEAVERLTGVQDEMDVGRALDAHL